MNTVEQWKPVKDYDGLYEVSSLGRVKSLNYNHTGKERIMKSEKHRDGYLRVQFYKDGKVKHFLVHRLVAEAFIPNPEGLPEINHKDEDKTNNVVGNLEFCSRCYNSNYGTRNVRIGAARSKAVEASKYPDFRTIELRFVSIQEAGRNGYNQGSVSTCCRGCYSAYRRNFYKNLYWRYAV